MAPTAGSRTRTEYAKGKSKKLSTVKKIPSIKNQIRALERYLSKPDLLDEIKNSKRKDLEALYTQQEMKEKLEKERALAVKNKKPRFFDRVKLMRKLRRLKKQVKEAAKRSKEVSTAKEIKDTRKRLMYIYYFPKNERYIPLSESLSEELIKRREELMQSAQKCYKNDEASHEHFELFCTNMKSREHHSHSSLPSLMKHSHKILEKRKKRTSKSKKSPKAAALVDQEEAQSQLEVPADKDCDVESDFFID